MNARLCCFIMALQMLSWVSLATRPFPPVPEEALQSSPYTTQSNKGMAVRESETGMQEEYERRGTGKIGSRPPRCEHKCYGCTPCEATQVPNTSRRNSHLGIQYANYEPESWKCKCGPSFYSP